MIYRRCKCGACERWDTGEAVAPCSGCSKCQTSFATGPDGHIPLAPHEWVPYYNSRTGEPDRRRCVKCHRVERVNQGESNGTQAG